VTHNKCYRAENGQRTDGQRMAGTTIQKHRLMPPTAIVSGGINKNKLAFQS